MSYNMMNNFSSFMTPDYNFSGFWGPFFWLLIIWSLAWKGIALWKSARQGASVWFVVILVANTLGILDILYIYVFSKKHGATDGNK